MVGGSSRDYLLRRPFTDFDFATSLKPLEIKACLKNAEKLNCAFAMFGTVSFSYHGYTITVASFRREGEYSDKRHPEEVEFITDPAEDSQRRDFTINAIYLDSSFRAFDPQNGLADLQAKTIRMIGPIEKRIKEDPLRILRAYRFASSLGFSLEDKLASYLEKNLGLIYEIRPEKVEQELKKFTPEGRQRMLALLGQSHKC
jgi:tRNA nucleotidyltransferase (CCA-adding enzyme)